jgi:hypothetical protein
MSRAQLTVQRPGMLRMAVRFDPWVLRLIFRPRAGRRYRIGGGKYPAGGG